jgi:tetratricopeptide (TPR) repeat protein
MGPDSSASDEIQRFEEQSRRQPESLVFARLADAYRKAGQPEKALAVLEDGLLRHPDYPSGHIVRARTLRDLGRVDETLQSFRRVLELDGGNLVAIMELARLADERGDADEARHWYGRLAQIDPANLESRQRLTELGSGSAEPAPESLDGEDAQAWWDDSAVTLDEADAQVWWSDSAGSVAGDAEEEARSEEPAADPQAGDALSDELRPDERRPEDEVVEAILNGDVPQTVKGEDTWWYEDAPAPTAPEPSRDADLLTRTMADLYAEQGLDREATEIYQELLEDSPGDPELLARLDRLSEKARVSAEASVPVGGMNAEEVEGGPEVANGDGVPAPLGRPAGLPVAEELRRLLRLGEERAGALPDPDSVGPDPGPGQARHPAPQSESNESTERTGRSEAERLSDVAREDESVEGPGRLALDWIQRLKADT